MRLSSNAPESPRCAVSCCWEQPRPSRSPYPRLRLRGRRTSTVRQSPRRLRTAAPAKNAAPAPTNGCDVCLEKSPLQSPSKYAGWNDTDVKKSYEAARKYPATIDILHCFCECAESPREHHKSLLTCFTNDHAAGCGICQHEAILAAKLKDEGASDEEVEYIVESLHKTDKHPPTKGRGI